MAEQEPFGGDWQQYNKGVFGRLITMFKWIIIIGLVVLAFLWAFTA